MERDFLARKDLKIILEGYDFTAHKNGDVTVFYKPEGETIDDRVQDEMIKLSEIKRRFAERGIIPVVTSLNTEDDGHSVTFHYRISDIVTRWDVYAYNNTEIMGAYETCCRDFERRDHVVMAAQKQWHQGRSYWGALAPSVLRTDEQDNVLRNAVSLLNLAAAIHGSSELSAVADHVANIFINAVRKREQNLDPIGE